MKVDGADVDVLESGVIEESDKANPSPAHQAHGRCSSLLIWRSSRVDAHPLHLAAGGDETAFRVGDGQVEVTQR